MRTAGRLISSIAAVAAGATLLSTGAKTQPRPSWIDAYRPVVQRLTAEEGSGEFAWRRLADLTDTIGARLSGSTQLDRAIAWTSDLMKADGLENVHPEPVLVPKWIRGRERAEIVSPSVQPIAMLGLGNSIGTPAQGIEADILVVKTFDELEAHRDQARGRIVVFNAPFTTYNDTVRYRRNGASRASQDGAVAVLVRSIGPPATRLPHTGELAYAPNAKPIPAAAVAAEDADRLQRLAERGPVRVRLTMEAHQEPDVESANVVGEIVGRERPDEIVAIGCHLDSWDVGAGASDDGVGCVMTWEALRLMRTLNLRARRTVRLVLWTNEENGVRGGAAYRDRHRDELPRHVALLESDIGAFHPTGFGFTGAAASRQIVQRIASLLAGIGVDQVTSGGSGADIDPSAREANIPELSLDSDTTRYFVIHHTAADTVDKIDPREVARGASAVAAMTYVLADMPMSLR